MVDQVKISPLASIKSPSRLNRRLSNNKRDSFAEDFSLFYDDGKSGKNKKKPRSKSTSGELDEYI